MMNRAREIRKLRGLLTQQQFANLMDVTRGTVIAWEQGGDVSLRSARRLVALGLPIELVLPEMKPTTAGDAA